MKTPNLCIFFDCLHFVHMFWSTDFVISPGNILIMIEKQRIFLVNGRMCGAFWAFQKVFAHCMTAFFYCIVLVSFLAVCPSVTDENINPCIAWLRITNNAKCSVLVLFLHLFTYCWNNQINCGKHKRGGLKAASCVLAVISLLAERITGVCFQKLHVPQPQREVLLALQFYRLLQAGSEKYFSPASAASAESHPCSTAG